MKFKAPKLKREKNTVYIRDLCKFNLISWFDFKLQPIFVSVPVASINPTYLKIGQKLPQYNNLASFTTVQSKSLIHAVEDR